MARGAKSATPTAYGLRRDGFRKNHKVGGQLSFVYMERSVLLLSQTVCKKVDVPFLPFVSIIKIMNGLGI